MKIGILMSTTALSTELIKSNAHLIAGEVELKVVFEDSAVDGSKMTLEQLFTKVRKDGVIPTTSQPTPYEIEDQIKHGLNNFDRLIAITPHSSLSGTYQSVCSAVNSLMVTDKVEVFEVNGGIACTEMALIDQTIKLISAGEGFVDIIEKLKQYNKRLTIYAFPADYNYLKLSGRVKGAQSLLLTAFNIRIVIKMENGAPFIDFKGRGTNSIYKYIINELSARPIEKIYYTPIADTPDIRNRVLAILEGIDAELEVTQEANVVPATHLGPKNFGLGVVYK